MKEREISIDIPESTYNYWHHLRLRKTYNQWSTYVKVARWAVETGSETYEIETIAARVKAIFPGHEDFVNAVLQITAQLTYNRRYPGIRHPIEVLVDLKADCDGFSIFVASILKAAGYRVILIVYESHMQCGVYLDNRPKGEDSGWRYAYDEKDYYICECAGQTSNWKTNWWHVGQCPEEYQTQSARLFTV